MLCLKLSALRKVPRDHNKNFGEKTRKYLRVKPKFCYDWYHYNQVFNKLGIKGPISTWTTLVKKYFTPRLAQNSERIDKAQKNWKKKVIKPRSFYSSSCVHVIYFPHWLMVNSRPWLEKWGLKRDLGTESGPLSQGSNFDRQQEWNWTVAQKRTIVDGHGSKWTTIRFQNVHFLISGPSTFAVRPLSVVRTVHFHPRRSTLIRETEFKSIKNYKIKKFRVREFSKSVDIIKEGDDGDEIFVLEEGKIEVYYTEDDGSE